MNSKVVIGVVVLILILGGGFLFMRGKSGSPAVTPTPTEEVMQKQNEEPALTPAESMEKNSVEIKDFAYNPATLTVKAGTTVTWTNKDVAGHSATADDKSFDTGVLSQGDTGTVTFSKAGTFAYHCTPHPNIKGTIVVEE